MITFLDMGEIFFLSLWKNLTNIDLQIYIWQYTEPGHMGQLINYDLILNFCGKAVQ